LFSAMLAMVLLSGCASQLSNYVRTDGAPIDAAQEKATLAQCKGEAAAIPFVEAYAWQQQQKKITEACMARNGYIQAQ
jgi:hypothetical protein